MTGHVEGHGPTGPQQPPQLPALRTFIVKRYALEPESDGGLETIAIRAHYLEYGSDGVVAFCEYVIDENQGIVLRKITRLLRHWEDVEELPLSQIVH